MEDSRRRIWIEASSSRFGSFAELNAWLGERCRSVWSDTVHPIHKQFTVAEMLALERPHLMSMLVLLDGYVEKPARVSSTCLVAVARNRYSVPCDGQGTWSACVCTPIWWILPTRKPSSQATPARRAVVKSSTDLGPCLDVICLSPILGLYFDLCE